MTDGYALEPAEDAPAQGFTLTPADEQPDARGRLGPAIAAIPPTQEPDRPSPEQVRQRGNEDFHFVNNTVAAFANAVDGVKDAISAARDPNRPMTERLIAGGLEAPGQAALGALGVATGPAIQAVSGALEKLSGGYVTSQDVQVALTIGGVFGPGRAALKEPLRGTVPSPIEPPKGSPAAPMARSEAARTGTPEVDAVLNSPTTKTVIDNPVVDRTHDVPYMAGGSTPLEDPTVYVDRHVPTEQTAPRVSDPSQSVTFDPADPWVVHENVEQHAMEMLIRNGMKPEEAYRVAHFEFAEKAEQAWYRAHDIDQVAAEKEQASWLPRIQHENPENPPPNLYDKPYPHADVKGAERESVTEAPPSPDEIARAMEIIRGAKELQQPDPLDAVNHARQLGVIGPERPEPTFADSPTQLAEQAMPRSLNSAETPEDMRTILGHAPGEYDARGKAWIDKIDEPEDVRGAIEKIAADNDYFPKARGGEVSKATRNAVAEAAGIDPSEIDAEHFSTHFDSDGKVRAVIQALRQTGKDFADASEAAVKDPTPENLAKAAEAELRHTHVLEYTMGLRADSGRTLAAWKDLLRATEETRAKVALRDKETTGAAPKGVADLVDAMGEVRENLKNPEKAPDQKPGLQRLIEAAQGLVDNVGKPTEDGKPPSSMTPEVRSLVDEARNTLKAFGADKDKELEEFRQKLTDLAAGNGKIGDTVEAARALLKSKEKPKATDAAPKVASAKGQLMGAAKRLVEAADDKAAAAKKGAQGLQDLMDAARKATGILKDVNRTKEISAFRDALAANDPEAAAAAAKALVEADGKVKGEARQRQPVEYDQVVAAARRVAQAGVEQAAREKPELMPDVKELLGNAKDAAKALQGERQSELGRLIDMAEKQAVDMTKQRPTRNPAEALPPELQGLVDKTQRIVKSFGGIAKGEEAALLLARTGRTAVEQEQLARSVSGLTPNQVAKVLSKLRTSPEASKPGWYYWLWQQGLISGLVTHTGYAITNLATVFSERVLTPFLGATLDRLRGGNASLAGPLYANVAMVHALPDALRAAGQAFKTNTRVPLASEMRLFARGEESPQSKGATNAFNQPTGPDWGIWKNVFNETQLDKAASALGTPGKAANMMHTFFKVLSERASASTRAFEEAHQEGVAGDKFWDRYQFHLDNPTDDALRGAVNDAYTGAFMAKLSPKVGAFAHALKDNPVLKWVFPFQHIPWNIVRMSTEYSPFAVLGPEMRAALLGKKGAPAQNLAIAKMTVGSTVIGYFMHKTLSGEATSDYPTDPTERRRWEMLGIQPNSIQINGEWVSYDRLGPAGNVAHMGASIGSIVHNWKGGAALDDNLTGTIWASSVAAANQIGNEVGFQSLKNIIDALENPQQGKRFAAWQIGSFAIPFSSFVSQNASLIDPDMRKANDLISGLKYRVPFAREQLLPKRDPLFGEPVHNPGYGAIRRSSPVNADPIKAEMDAIGYYPTQPARQVGKVKLSPELYDEYQGTAGAMVKETLGDYVRTPGWHDMAPADRLETVRATVKAARQSAGQIVLGRHPEAVQ